MTKKPPPSEPSPLKYHWEKGGPSPNPFGRPKKKHLNSLFGSLNPLAAKVLNHALRVIGAVNGEDITNFDAVMMSLAKRGNKETAASRLYTQLTQNAQAMEQEVRNGMLLAAMTHKDTYGLQFARAKRLGCIPPNVLPHPDDIIIEPDGSVKIVGPVSWHGQMELEAILTMRDFCIDAGAILARAEGRLCDQDVALALWKQVRRKFYRFNAKIPPRLKKPYPRFEP